MNTAKAKLAAIGCAALIATAIALPEVAADVKTGDRAAELVSVKDGRGRRMKLKSYRGKLVVITFGASWCKPCKKELPAWDKLARKYKGKGVVFIAVNIDKDLAKGKAFIKQAGIKVMRCGYEPSGATVASYEPPTMPTTYVVDKRGLVRMRHSGYRSGDEETLAAKLDALLKK